VPHAFLYQNGRLPKEKPIRRRWPHDITTGRGNLRKCCNERERTNCTTLAALNDANVLTEDIINAYLNAPIIVKIWTIANSPFQRDYRSGLDTSPELDPETATYYQSQIGVLRRAVELGRIDIMTEVSMLSAHLALPRNGHLKAIYRTYAYLKIQHNAQVCYDPPYPAIDESRFQNFDWKHTYGDAAEALPHNAPPPRGKDIDLRLYVDSDHAAGEKLNRRSRTGYMVLFFNSALIVYGIQNDRIRLRPQSSEPNLLHWKLGKLQGTAL
jgi:hypothetical protein